MAAEHQAHRPLPVDGPAAVLYGDVYPWYPRCYESAASEFYPNDLLLSDPFQDTRINLADFSSDRYYHLATDSYLDYDESPLASEQNLCYSATGLLSPKSPEMCENHENAYDDGENIPRKESHTMVQPGAYASGNYAGHLMESHISTDPPESNPRGQQFPNTPLEMESESTSKATNRKRAHNQIEKRYREGLNSKFLQLEDVLRNRHDHILPDQQSKRSKRAEVLEIAYDNILELQGEVRSLKKKLEILRKAALPSETWKFTLGDDDSIKPV